MNNYVLKFIKSITSIRVSSYQTLKSVTKEEEKIIKGTEINNQVINDKISIEINETVKKEKKIKKVNSPENIDISHLDLRVGKIITCEKHPLTDKLYVKQVDIGEERLRNICSNLVNHMTIDQLKDRLVVVICNLKAATFKGKISEAIILCASSSERTELLMPPSNCEVGEKVSVKGFEGLPVKEINNRTDKILRTVKFYLKTNSNCIATYDGKPLEVSDKGFVTCSTLKNTEIK